MVISRFAKLTVVAMVLGMVPVCGAAGPVVKAELAPAAASGAMAGGGQERRERHPEIRQAIAALERAKSHMQSANHDFGGHRVEALQACDAAIAQLKQALQFDKE